MERTPFTQQVLQTTGRSVKLHGQTTRLQIPLGPGGLAVAYARPTAVTDQRDGETRRSPIPDFEWLTRALVVVAVIALIFSTRRKS